MNIIDQSDTTPLVILDVQDAIDHPIWDGKNNPEYVVAIQRILAHWRKNGWPVLHIKHDEPSSTSTYHTHGPWNGIKKDVAPITGETIIAKQQNCAFIGTDLDVVLKGMNADQLILTGVVIHNSMDATVRAGKAAQERRLAIRSSYHPTQPQRCLSTGQMARRGAPQLFMT